MPQVGFEPTISAGEQPKTYAVDRAATGTGHLSTLFDQINDICGTVQIMNLFIMHTFLLLCTNILLTGRLAGSSSQYASYNSREQDSYKK